MILKPKFLAFAMFFVLVAISTNVDASYASRDAGNDSRQFQAAWAVVPSALQASMTETYIEISCDIYYKICQTDLDCQVPAGCSLEYFCQPVFGGIFNMCILDEVLGQT